MSKTNFTHFTILLKTRLKTPNFVDMSISTDPIKSEYERVEILRTVRKAYISGS